MTSSKEIRDRINGIAETKKITTAMYLIASTKMRRVRSELEHTRPYFDALRAEVRRMFRAAGVELVPYLHTGRRIELEV